MKRVLAGLARNRKGEAGVQEFFVFLVFLMAFGGVAATQLAERTEEYSPERLEQIRNADFRGRVEEMRPEFEQWALAALDYEGWVACKNHYLWPMSAQVCGPEPYRPWDLVDIDPNSEEFRALGREQDPAKRRVIEVFMTWQGREDRDSVVPDPSILVQHRYRWTNPSLMEALVVLPATAIPDYLATVGEQEIAGGTGQTTYEWGEWGRRID